MCADGTAPTADDAPSAEVGVSPGSLRLDKWLWFARFFKSRTRAADLAAAGKLRLNRVVVRKAHQPVRPGDVLTFPQGTAIRVIRVARLGTRRGPAPEAQGLYEDLAPLAPRVGAAPGAAEVAPEVPRRTPGSGRPTKKERRAIARLKEES